MLQKLKERVVEANRELERRGLVIYTWGNVSGILRDEGLVVIKPSGVPYEDLAPDNMVVLDLEGNVVEGSLRPSSDTPTHLELYRRFPEAGNRPYPFIVGNHLGTGWEAHPLPRHHSCRLLLWRNPLHQASDQGRGGGGL